MFDPLTVREATEVMADVPEGLPGHDDLWLRLAVYVYGGDFSAGRELVEESAQAVEALPELKVLDVALQLRVADTVQDGKRRDQLLTAALADAREVQRHWPDLVQAYRLPCELLQSAPPKFAPVDMARKVTELAPNYAHGATRYWFYLLLAESKPWEERKREVLALVDRAVADHPDEPDWLFTAADAYASIGEQERAASLTDRILERHPDSPEAEVTRYDRLRVAREELESTPSPAERKQQMDAWRRDAWAFFERAAVHDRHNDGLIAMMLFFSYAEDKNLSNTDRAEQMIDLAQRMRAFEVSNPHTVYVVAPRFLLERADAPVEAESLARAGVDFASGYYFAFRLGQTLAELEALGAPLLSEVHGTIGWIAFRRGKRDEAVAALEEAVRLDPKNAGAHLVLGTIARERGDLDQAREHLLLAHEQATGDDRAEAESELFKLFEASGESQSFQDFLEEQVEQQTERRKQKILANRKRGPKMRGLEGLVPLGDEPEALATAGKIVIVNVWTTYCGPCIEEMPELERLWETFYSADPDVEMLTVSADLNPDDARSFRERNGYRIPAYHDRGFTDRLGVRIFPTTLFFDRSGHLAFRTSDKARADELAWRVEALR